MFSIFVLIADEGMRGMTKQLRKNRVEIVKSLKVTDDLITELNAGECISDRQHKHLLKLPLSRRSSKLLDLMLLKNILEYETFIGVLLRTERVKIAVMLDPSGV